jgi:hypothetical protein
MTISGIAISGANSTSFGQAGTCGASLGAGASCAVTVSFSPTITGPLAGSLTFADNAAGSPQTVVLSGTGVAAAYSALIVPASIAFQPVTVGLSSAPQAFTVKNTGTGALTLTGISLSGGGFTVVGGGSCLIGSSLAPGASCTANVVSSPTASGNASANFIVQFSGTVSVSPSGAAVVGSGVATAIGANAVDCSVSAAHCPGTFSPGGQLATDPISAGGFHGYADPSMRKDPNSGLIYMAYSWPKTLADGTHVVDLHLSASADLGNTFTYVGPLYQSVQTTQTASSAYSAINDSSTETIDLLPVPLSGSNAGQTLWVQAHQSYLVAPKGGIYDQLDATSTISVSAVQLASPAGVGAATALLGLSTAPEARLGAASTDASRNITQSLYGLATASQKCGNWGQATLWYQTGTLYLALECSEITGTSGIDANELAHFLYSTSPVGSDASKWTWSYVGEFATGAQAAKMGALGSEGVGYQFFTEPEFVQTTTGQLAILLTPSVFAPQSSTQPVTQYGCRLVPILALSPSGITLDTDATTGALVILSKVTEADLYTTPNQGPAACTYEPAAVNGIVMGRKFEKEPTLGFYLYPLSSGVAP